MVGFAVLVGDPQDGEFALEVVVPWRILVVKTSTLSVNVDSGMPWMLIVTRKVSRMIVPATAAWC